MSLRHNPLYRRARLVASSHRTQRADTFLAFTLAAIAGALNAGGFLFFGHYTSHMTGYMSQIADQIVLENFMFALQGVTAVVLFIAGATTSAFIINWAKHNRPKQRFSLPLGLQGVLLMAFAASDGIGLPDTPARMFGLALLCFVMGLQNATITKISGAVIRTTHVTGVVTDIGIELGRGLYGASHANTSARINKPKLRILSGIVAMFLLGGITGALGYSLIGNWFSLPMAGVLLILALLPNLHRSSRLSTENQRG